MDLNLKGKSWAGNIYHQFESICQDVDGFMSKDTVKLVENQMQNVGISVKKFYSNVVQDILPLSENIVKPKSQLLDGEQVDTRDHVNFITDISTDPTCTNEKELSINQGSVNTLRNSNASLPIEVGVKRYTDSAREEETYPHLTEDGDAVIRNDGIEDYTTKDSIPVTSSSFKSKIFSGMSDEYHKNSELTIASSPSFSAHKEGHTSIEREKGVFNQQKEKEGGLSDEAEYHSNILRSHWLVESKLQMVEGPNSDENRSSNAPPVASVHKFNEDNSPMMDSPLPSACDVSQIALEEEGTLCHSLSIENENLDLSSSVQSPEFVFSYFSCKEEEKEMGIMSSTYSTSPKSSHILDSTSENVIKNAENICHTGAEPDDCAYNISTPTSTDAAYETKAIDMLPAFQILELNDDNAFPTDGANSILGSFHEEPYKDSQSETARSPSETGNTCECGVGIGDLDMETVDLSPDAERDGRSVGWNVNFVGAASYRRKNFRYYKKLIQDAFTSRKRLSKEYEHLAILYGDIDMESSQHFEPSSAPSIPNTSVHGLRTQSSQEMCGTEWELL